MHDFWKNMEPLELWETNVPGNLGILRSLKRTVRNLEHRVSQKDRIVSQAPFFRGYYVVLC